MRYSIKEGNYSVMGVHIEYDTVTFTFECDRECNCAILLFAKKGDTTPIRIDVPGEYCIGSLRSIAVKGLKYKQYEYCYECDGQMMIDPYAKVILGREKWADMQRGETEHRVRCGFDSTKFDWMDDKSPAVSKRDMVMYKLHVRGFSMDDPTVRGKKKGTFRAIIDKIDYLKELGVTSLELMPVYEFEELQFRQPYGSDEKLFYKTNYWGYGDGDYFAPKASYAYGRSAIVELKELVRELHKNGIECIMEMHFGRKVNRNLILDALKFWSREYHIDGFHVIGMDLPLSSMTQDPMLSRTKLFCEYFPDELQDESKRFYNLYEYRDDFCYPIRNMLNHLGGDMQSVTGQMRKQRRAQGYVNYIASNNGFTLADVFAYNEKHNMDNGENNADGTEYNCSYNYGVEGVARRKFIKDIRRRQQINALALLFLAQGVPMIMAGDEWGNSQKGNNNAYCQDNKIGWINWREEKKNADLANIIKKLIQFRKEHKIIHREEPMCLCDYRHIGYPDLSYHCDNAWASGFDSNRQSVGIMFCDRVEGMEQIEKIYIGINFSADKQILALPQLPAGEQWYRIMDTSDDEVFLKNAERNAGKHVKIADMSVCILIGNKEVQKLKPGPKVKSVRTYRKGLME